MKIPITDKFLRDLYESLRPAGNLADIFLVPRTSYKFIRRIWNEQNPVYKKYHKDMNNKIFNKLIYWLKVNNYIKIENLKSKQVIILTKKGSDKVFKSLFKFENTKFEKRKDTKWIMIIFDIPKEHNKSRNLLRSILKNLGYKLFQHSVWITPYDVADETEKLLQFYSLDNYVRLFLIEKL